MEKPYSNPQDRVFEFVPGRILVWAVRDTHGKLVGWEVFGQHTGAAGGPGVDVDTALALVRENMVATTDTVIVVHGEKY